MVFGSQENKQNFFGEKIIYFRDVNVFEYGPKCCTSGEKYKIELKNLSYKN